MRHKHYDVIVAWANGEEIEYRINSSDFWTLIVDPSWCHSTEYRIKPKIVKKEGWVNVYPMDPYVHDTKKVADDFACKNRIACVFVEWEEEE